MSKNQKIIIVLVVLFLVFSLALAGCVKRIAKREPPVTRGEKSMVQPPQNTTTKPAQAPVVLDGNFAFGLEYVFPTNGHKIARHYSEIGTTWSKFNGPGTLWEDVEPEAPVGGVHHYHWSNIDEAVKAMQEAGFLNLTVVIGSRSKWGSKPIPKGEGLWEYLSGHTSTAPKDEHWQDWRDWVYAFVERYDHNGLNDMPGLKAPVLYYEIMTEAQHDGYWRGTVEEYIRVLKTSYEAAKSANPKAQIILSGFMFADLFDEGPLTEAEISEKLTKTPSQYPALDVRRKTTARFQEQLEFNRRILKEKDYFDIVEFHLLSNYTALEGIVKWIREEMQKNGYQKPIWVGDAGAVPQIPSHHRTGFGAAFNTFNQFAPALYDDGDKIFEVLTSRQDQHGYTYQDVRAWFLKEQSYFLTKSLLTEMSLGVEGTHIYTWLDGLAQKWMPGALKNWQIAGLRDGNILGLNVGKPRPVFYTYQLIIEKLGKFSSVQKFDLGKSQVKAYKFIVSGRPLYVLWYDDGLNQKPGEIEPTISLDLSSIIGSPKVKVTPVIITEDQSAPQVEVKSTSQISLSEAPIFVEVD